MHPPIPCNKPIPRNALLCHAKICSPMSYKFIRLLKRPLVQQKINPLPRRKLPRLMFPFPPFRPATLFSNRMPSRKLRQVTLMRIDLHFRLGFLHNRTLGCSHRKRF